MLAERPRGTEEQRVDAGSPAVAAAVERVRTGDPVIVTDDGTERHGVLVAAAALVSSSTMAFVIRESSGLVCAAMPSRRLDELRLPPMAARVESDRAIASCAVSVDLREGVLTGISARERAATLRALGDPACGPDDFVRPGHVLPIRAADDGVLGRPAVPEAAMDVCRLAGLPPAAVLATLTTEDGQAADEAGIRAFALAHGLPVVTVAEIVRVRQGSGPGETVAPVDTPAPVDPARMRAGLGHFATGIVVVTAMGSGGPLGFTCQSFASLSLDPPLVTFAPARTSSTWPRIRSVGRFCVNVLAAGHQEHSASFARSGVDKFAGLGWRAAPSGSPVLDGILAWIDCTLWQEYDGGDHTVVVGRVHDLGASDDRDPLLFFRGAYELLAR
jgi:3-hydroxy-9,10-secoandrosta-1,3,5(10)-triene-9,17-dione monooxygenase reductase component